ncbi:MAG: hypothetical protein ABSC19_07955 [Syntrophorhabdales bacterium]|jgi:flagellar motor switch protein FliM
MADVLSQDDLNALLGLMENAPAEPVVQREEKRPPVGGLSQEDLDSLLGGLAGPVVQAAPAGQEEEKAGAESLSQDEIDKLLAEFGK